MVSDVINAKQRLPELDFVRKNICLIVCNAFILYERLKVF